MNLVNEWILPAIALFAIVLVFGVQNLVVIDLYCQRVHRDQIRRRLRWFGLGLSLVLQWVLVMLFDHVQELTKPILSLGEWNPSLRDLLYVLGGAFLFYRSVFELMQTAQGEMDRRSHSEHSLLNVMILIVVADVFFSLDVALAAAALGPANSVVIGAIATAMLVLISIHESLVRFLERQASMQTLAHAFVALLGLAFAAQGMHWMDSIVWIYPMLAFALMVEILNMRRRSRERLRQNWRELE